MGYFIGVQYVEPVIERLDSKGIISYRLSRPATKYMDGKHYRVCILLYILALGIWTHSLLLIYVLAPEYHRSFGPLLSVHLCSIIFLYGK
jgi:uncharacterized membrane protein YbhN (UPF0104 family)